MAAMVRSAGSSLELRGLAKRYAALAAVENLSLQVEPGEFVSLLGPSGSGKTTTLMLIAGFIEPDRGHVVLDGVDITTLPPHRRNIGTVYQNYALFPHMSVAKNVAFPLEMRGLAHEEIGRLVSRALDMVQLADRGGRYPRQLSGGQQQRVALARALVFEPPLLLMDEPLGALDKKLRGEMQHEIKSIQRRLGITTIYVTHDQEEALSMSDRVVVMRGGRIEQAASPTALYDRPANGFVAEFIGAANLLHAAVTGLGDAGTLRTPGGLSIAATVAGMKIGEAVTAVLRPERIRLSRQTGNSAPGHAAKVHDASFAGGVWRYRVVLDTGEPLVVIESHVGAEPHRIGAPVTVDWLPQDVWITRTEMEARQ